MVTRKIIEINRELCNGCGECITACAEGALKLDDEGKAVLVNEIYCDGLGVCLDVCPTGALKVVEREALAFDEKATMAHTNKDSLKTAQLPVCPGMKAMNFNREKSEKAPSSQSSMLQNWPLQLKLVSPMAPYLKNCNLLIAADCTAFAHPNFHAQLLKDRICIIACPKLDADRDKDVEKLTSIFNHYELKSLTLAIMEVPCCRGLEQMVNKALEKAGSKLSFERKVIPIQA